MNEGEYEQTWIRLSARLARDRIKRLPPAFTPLFWIRTWTGFVNLSCGFLA